MPKVFPVRGRRPSSPREILEERPVCREGGRFGSPAESRTPSPEPSACWSTIRILREEVATYQQEYGLLLDMCHESQVEITRLKRAVEVAATQSLQQPASPSRKRRSESPEMEKPAKRTAVAVNGNQPSPRHLGDDEVQPSPPTARLPTAQAGQPRPRPVRAPRRRVKPWPLVPTVSYVGPPDNGTVAKLRIQERLRRLAAKDRLDNLFERIRDANPEMSSDKNNGNGQGDGRESSEDPQRPRHAPYDIRRFLRRRTGTGGRPRPARGARREAPPIGFEEQRRTTREEVRAEPPVLGQLGPSASAVFQGPWVSDAPATQSPPVVGATRTLQEILDQLPDPISAVPEQRPPLRGDSDLLQRIQALEIEASFWKHKYQDAQGTIATLQQTILQLEQKSAVQPPIVTRPATPQPLLVSEPEPLRVSTPVGTPESVFTAEMSPASVPPPSPRASPPRPRRQLFPASPQAVQPSPRRLRQTATRAAARQARINIRRCLEIEEEPEVRERLDIPRATFRRIIRGMLAELNGELRIENDAIELMQYAGEDHIGQHFASASSVALQAGRVTVRREDFDLLASLQDAMGGRR